MKTGLAKKVVVAAVAAAAVIGGYYYYKNGREAEQQVRYVLGTASKGTLIVSVSGTGQVAVTQQVDVKPKASGEIVSVLAKEGQKVKAGEIIARLDASDAAKDVRDAETALEMAMLSLEKIRRGEDGLTLLQAENALTQAKLAKDNAVAALDRAYDDGFTDVSDAFLDLPAVMTGLNGILYGTEFSSSNANIDAYSDVLRPYFPGVVQYRDDAEGKYRAARDLYELTFQQYKVLSRSSEPAVIEDIIARTGRTAEAIGDALKSADNLIRFYQDKTSERGLTPKPLAAQHLSSLGSHTGTINMHISSMRSAGESVADAKAAIDKAERDIAEREGSLAEVKEGPDPLDVRSQEIAVAQRRDALADAREKLADYTVRVPFDGVIAKVDVKKGDEASASTAVATLITEQKTAEISLNEIDAAKIAVDQKATITFDAIEDLTVSGKVASIDTLGTVSQGVVSYSVVISMDADDERVKPGMSVSAAIVTDVRTDVILVPASAVKSAGDVSYVETPDGEDVGATGSTGTVLAKPPVQKEVVAGLTDGISTEIIEGLAAGDVVITRTISSSTTTSNGTGARGSSVLPGGAVRIQGGMGGGNFQMRDGR